MSVAVSLHGRYFRRDGFRELDRPAYVQDIIDPLARYSERDTPLSRGYVPPGGWDESFLGTLLPVIGEQGPGLRTPSPFPLPPLNSLPL
jgi:hypothetical protein